MKINYCLTNESFKYTAGESICFNNTSISLFTAKRDWAAFQVLLKGAEDITVSVGENPYFSPAGPLPNIRMKTRLEGFDDSLISMHPIGLIDDDDGSMKTDIILGNEVVTVKEGEVQSVWVEIKVPQNVVEGVYKGVVELYAHSMFEAEKFYASMEFELQVKNVTLPEPHNYSFYLDLWQHLSNIARKHEVRLWSDEHFEVIEEYVKTLAELGQKAVTIIVSEIPWSGQRCFKYGDYLSDLFEYSMVKVTKSLDGAFGYDFSAVERYIGICESYGINSEIEVFGLINIWTSLEEGYGGIVQDYPDAVRVRYFDKGDGCYKYVETANEIKNYIKVLEQFFIEKGLINRVRIVADEPADVPRYKEVLDIIKDAAPSFKFKTAINHVEFIGEFKDKIEDFVPFSNCVCEKWNLLENIRESIKGRLLWYICCIPDIPNTFISSPLLESRLIGILTAYMKFDGFLRWNYTVWPEEPRKRLSYRYPGWKAGDTNFVYPAQNGKPLLSLRYKNLKRGIEDFELINLLRRTKTNPDELLRKVYNPVIKMGDVRDMHPEAAKLPEDLYSLTYKDYQSFRMKILDELENGCS